MRHNYHLISLFLTLFFAIPVFANRDWVKMKALAENSVVTVVRTNKPSNYNMQYFDQTTQQWIDFNVNHTVDLVINLPAVGDSVMFRGQNPEGLGRVEDSNYKYIRFKPTKGEVAVSGDIMTLIDTTETMVNVVPGDGCFLRLFNDATCLYEAKDLRLPAAMTSKASYQDMFRACKNLRSAPDMTALEYIEEGACQRMFMGCSTLVQTANMSGLVVVGDNGCSAMYSSCVALTFAHDLVAKYVDQRSYMSMFSSCTSLLAAPRIDAYEMRYETCKQMFYKCSALKSSPDLNAQLLDNGCYESMFEECSSLVHAPALKATDLAYTYGKTSTVYESCYKWMFKNCGKLETIEVYFSKWRGNSSHTYEPTGAWAMGVPKKNTCVFSAPCGLYEEYGQSRIPEFWQFNCFHFFLFDVYSTGAVWDDDRSDYANRALKESDLAQMPRAHKDNNIFLGWNTQPDGTGEMFNLEAMPDTTTVYYAVFQSLVPEEEEVERDTVVKCKVTGERLAKTLYRDPSKQKEQDKLLSELHTLASSMQDIPLKYSFWDLFTEEEIRAVYDMNNTRMRLVNGIDPFNHDIPARCAASLWQNIVETADSVIAVNSNQGTLPLGGQGVGCTLRFGHDTCLYHLLSLIGFFDGVPNLMDEILPMGANLQIIFYHNAEGHVIVKFLHNEREVKYNEILCYENKPAFEPPY